MRAPARIFPFFLGIELSGVGFILNAAANILLMRCSVSSGERHSSEGLAMIESPASYDHTLSDADLKMIGKLAVSWSTTEHVIGNCLKGMLRLTDDEAVTVVFSLNLERRINYMVELAKSAPWEDDVRKLLKELKPVMTALQSVRSNVVHSIVIDDETGAQAFHLRSKNKSLPKDHAFSSEELTNYAAHLVLALRFAISFKPTQPVFSPPTLPGRPPIPEFLQSFFQGHPAPTWAS